jgi:hypothetical protein
MDAALVERLEAAVARLEAAASGASLSSAAPRDLDVPAASDPAIVAYDEFVAEAVGRLTAAAEKIGGKVLDAIKVLAEAFAVAKDLLVQAKQLQVTIGRASLRIRSGRFACATRVDLLPFGLSNARNVVERLIKLSRDSNAHLANHKIFLSTRCGLVRISMSEWFLRQ